MHPILALQRQIGNRAVTRLLTRRTDEEAMKDLEMSMTSLVPDADHVARTVSQYTFDREGWGKVNEAYKSSHEDKEMAPAFNAMTSRFDEDEREKVDRSMPR